MMDIIFQLVCFFGRGEVDYDCDGTMYHHYLLGMMTYEFRDTAYVSAFGKTKWYSYQSLPSEFSQNLGAWLRKVRTNNRAFRKAVAFVVRFVRHNGKITQLPLAIGVAYKMYPHFKR